MSKTDAFNRMCYIGNRAHTAVIESMINNKVMEMCDENGTPDLYKRMNEIGELSDINLIVCNLAEK